MTLNRLNFNRFLRQLIFISLLTLISSTSIAAIYKWTDAEGNVHYGQQRPKEAPSQRIKVPQYTPQNTSTYKRPALKTKDENAKKNAETPEEEKTTETAAEKKQRLKDCEQIRQNLSLMEARGRIRSQDKDGNTRYLSQEEKEARMAKSRKTLSKHCK